MRFENILCFNRFFKPIKQINDIKLHIVIDVKFQEHLTVDNWLQVVEQVKLLRAKDETLVNSWSLISVSDVGWLLTLLARFTIFYMVVAWWKSISIDTI